MQMDPNDSRLWQRIEVISCATFGLPMLLIREHPWHALCAWLLVVVMYLGLLCLFGAGFALEGALVAFILACVLGLAMKTFFHLKALKESREGSTSVHHSVDQSRACRGSASSTARVR